MTHFKIITAIYNATLYFPGYVESIVEQIYDDYEVIVVDDASTDQTTQMVVDACRENDWTCVLQNHNRGAVYNQVHAIRALECKPDDVLVFVDGDDRLAHKGVLDRLNFHYSDGTLLTYGSYAPSPPSRTCSLACPFPQEMLTERNFRDVAAGRGGIYWNHLRTFKYSVFEQMDDSDFVDKDGLWYKTATDAAFMYPALELAAPHIKYLNELMYIYTSDNRISDWRRWPRQCDRDHMDILGKKPKR